MAEQEDSQVEEGTEAEAASAQEPTTSEESQEATSKAEEQKNAEPSNEDGNADETTEKKLVTKKMNFVPQWRLNQMARDLRLQRQQNERSTQYIRELTQALQKALNPAGTKEDENQPLTRAEYQRLEDERVAKTEKTARVEEAINYSRAEQKRLADAGLEVPDNFEDILKQIIEDANIPTTDPMEAVKQGIALFLKENVVETSGTPVPKSSNDTEVNTSDAEKTPEQIRSEQKTKASGVGKSRKVNSKPGEITEDMSLEDMRKVLGTHHRSNNVWVG